MSHINPLSRSPDLTFKDIQITLLPNPELTVYQETRALYLGKVEATAKLVGYLDTKIFFKLYKVTNQSKEYLVFGSRCGFLHSPHINVRNTQAEHLWCTHCWSDSLINVPFYLYYRHFDSHVIDHIPPCTVCHKRFQVWDPDTPLKEGYTHLFSALKNTELEGVVESFLKN
jgi:hypothetical protein